MSKEVWGRRGGRASPLPRWGGRTVGAPATDAVQHEATLVRVAAYGGAGAMQVALVRVLILNTSGAARCEVGRERLHSLALGRCFKPQVWARMIALGEANPLHTLSLKEVWGAHTLQTAGAEEQFVFSASGSLHIWISKVE